MKIEKTITENKYVDISFDEAIDLMYSLKYDNEKYKSPQLISIFYYPKEKILIEKMRRNKKKWQ